MIEVRGLTKRFGAFVAVDNVSFRVEAGEVFALLGPNGSGKTTTLKCLVNLMLPTSGQITVNGVDIRESPRAARRLMSYLPQRVAFPECVTAREVLEFYCRLRSIPVHRIELALERARFNGFAGSFVSEFSGGMLQRLGLAVAFLPAAPILILDEPTVSLDLEGVLKLKEFIGALKAEGKTVVLSSHVLPEVEQLADRVGVLVGGKLVGVESVGNLRQARLAHSRLVLVLRNPEARFTEVCLACGAREAQLAGQSLSVRCKPEDCLPIMRAVENAGGVIERFSTEEPSLEDVYLGYVDEKSPSAGGPLSGGLPV